MSGISYLKTKTFNITQCVNGFMNEGIRVHVSLNTAYTFTSVPDSCMRTSTLHYTDIAQVTLPKYTLV